MYMMIVIALT
jgi:hypothetical protein